MVRQLIKVLLRARTKITLFLFPIGYPKIDDAIDNTLNDNNLDYLTDITISEEFLDSISLWI